jgi:hypothetical protein
VGERAARVLPPHKLVQLGQVSHTRTLRADPPSEQQVHSKVSLRRAVDAVQRCGVCSNHRPSGFGKRPDAQAACEPGGEGCGGVPVHPARLHTHRTLFTTLMNMLNPTSDLLSHWPPSCVGCLLCTIGSLRAERGWVTAVHGAPQRWVF